MPARHPATLALRVLAMLLWKLAATEQLKVQLKVRQKQLSMPMLKLVVTLPVFHTALPRPNQLEASESSVNHLSASCVSMRALHHHQSFCLH